MKKLLVIALIIISSISLFGQQDYYNAENRKKMKDLSVMIGNWKGEGWMMNQKTKKKESFTQTEIIRYDLDSTVILINGTGKDGEKIIHDAFALISVNPEGGYHFNSFLGDGKSGKYQAEMENGVFTWEIPVAMGTVRYTSTITEDKWVEKGDFGMDDKWFPFFEMTLTKE